MNNPYPALAANLYKFSVIGEAPRLAHSLPASPAAPGPVMDNGWLSALLAIEPARMPIRFVPEPAPDKPENAALHTAAQKTLHYTVNALLHNLEIRLNQPQPPDSESKSKPTSPASRTPRDAHLLNSEEEAALYWLANQLLQKSVTRTNHPIFTYRNDNGEIKRQKHFNQLNSSIKRLRGIITASRLGDHTLLAQPSTEPNEVAHAIGALHFPNLADLVKAEEIEWNEKAKTQQYNEIFLDLNTLNPFNPGSEAAFSEPATNTVDRNQPNELEGFRAAEIIRYHAAKHEQKPNPETNNAQAWTLTPEPPLNGSQGLQETKRYVWDKAEPLFDKAEQTSGIGFQLPEARWTGNRTYALPHALRKMYEALEKQNQDLAELDPSVELLQTLQKEHFSLGIARACQITGYSYAEFKIAWDNQLQQNPQIIQTATRPEAIFKVLKQVHPQSDTATKLRFLEEFAVTGGYCIEISPRQQQYREQVTDILANIVSEIQLQRLTLAASSDTTQTESAAPNAQKGAALEALLRTPISSVLRRELEANVRLLLKKDLETDSQLKEAILELKKTSADLRDTTYIVQRKTDALNYILNKLADSPESIQTSAPVLIPPGTQFHRNLEFLIDHLPTLKHVKEEELTGAALTYLAAKKKPNQNYCLGLAEHGDPELTRKLQHQVDQAIVFLQREAPLPVALAQAREQLSILTIPAHQLTHEQRQANHNYFAGLARASTLWRNKFEQEQYRVPQKGYSALQYASNLAHNRLNNEFFKNKLPFSPQMQTDLLILGLNILEKWKSNPAPENNPRRHLPNLQKLSLKLANTLQIDSAQAQKEAQRGLNLPEIIREKTEQALFNFLRAESANIAQELLQIPLSIARRRSPLGQSQSLQSTGSKEPDHPRLSASLIATL